MTKQTTRPEAAPTTSVYEESPTLPGRRRDRTLDLFGSASRPRRRPRVRPDRKLMTRSMGALAIFVVVVAVVTAGAVKIFHSSWDSKTQPATRRPSPRPSPGAASPTPSATEQVIASPDPVARDRERAREGLNTETMRRALFLAGLGETLAANGNRTEAIARFQEALQLWPHMGQAWAAVGTLYLEELQLDSARTALTTALQSQPSNADLLHKLGMTYLLQGELGPAEDAFRASMDVDRQFAASHFSLIQALRLQGKEAAAEQVVDDYLLSRSNDPRALREKATFEARKGRYEAAMERLRRAIQNAPDWVDLYFDAAAASALLTRNDDAIRYLERAETLTTPDKVYQQFLKPAFTDVRRSELGKMFEEVLAERARRMMSTPRPQGRG